MSSIDDKLFKLNEMLVQEAASYEISQKMQFEWLQTIIAQIDFYSSGCESPTRNISIQKSPGVENEIHNIVENAPQKLHTTPSALSPPIKRTPPPIPRPKPGSKCENNLITPPKIPNSKVEKPCARSGSARKHHNLANSAQLRNSQRIDSPMSNLYSPHKAVSQKNNENVNNESESELTNLPISGNRSATSPCLISNGIKFVDDDSILMDDDDSNQSDSGSDLDDEEDPVPFTVSGSMRELTQSASSFREKWMEMLHQKKAATSMPKKPFKFAFDDNDEGIPENYQMSDDEENNDDDEAMYERNPVEIHGKMIPIWARGDQLLKQLKRQQRIDPDSIFLGFTADCPLPELFGTNKARWDNRQDSGWWDADMITDEEVERFKAALGLQ